MVRPALLALLAFASGAILDLLPADAMTISAINPYYSAVSDNCSSKWDSDLPFTYAQLLAAESSGTHVAGCRPDLSPDPVKIADATEADPTEEFDTRLYGIELQSENEDFERDDFSKVLDADRGYSGTDSCFYLERDHQILRAEDDTHCGIFEPGSDYTQLIGVFTLSVLAILSFAVVPLAWLLGRYYRAWRLRRFASARLGSL